MGPPGERFQKSLLSRLAAESRGRERFDPRKEFVEELGLLLNARYPANSIPEEYLHASESILAFGLPDTTDVSLKSGQARNALAVAIQDTLRIFEPRLTAVRVSVDDSTEAGLAVFSIEATLKIGAESEPLRLEVIKATSDSKFALRNRT